MPPTDDTSELRAKVQAAEQAHAAAQIEIDRLKRLGLTERAAALQAQLDSQKELTRKVRAGLGF